MAKVFFSFESNIPASSYLDIVQRVLNTFKPGKFILTIFANRVGNIQTLKLFLGNFLLTVVDFSPPFTIQFKSKSNLVKPLFYLNSL